MKQAVDLLRGIKLAKAYIDRDIINDFSGVLKSVDEKDIRRLIIEMLIKGILEE